MTICEGAALEGAACMNNTFCLAIFFALIWYQRLTWNYTAEVTSIVLIEVIVGLFAMKSNQTMMMACAVLACYPLSIAVVWAMQNITEYKMDARKDYS